MDELEHVACALCGAGDAKPLLTTRDWVGDPQSVFTLVHCACGLVYLNPRPTPQALARYYPDSYAPFHPPSGIAGWLQDRARQRGISHLVRLLPKGGRVLEVGCGSGEYLAMLRGRAWRAFGLEPSRHAASVARLRYGLPVVAGHDAALDGFRAESFDLVIMRHVLEHVSDPVRTISSIRRILKNDGRLLLELPNLQSVEASLFGQYWHGLDAPRHLYHFAPLTLHRMLLRCGFQVLHLSHDIAPNDWIGSLYRLTRAFGADEPLLSWLSIQNPLLLLLFAPLGWGTGRLRTSGRMKVLATPVPAG